jgi:hypothetical protein
MSRTNDTKLEEGMEIYDLLMDEFEPAGGLCPHTIQKGAKEEGAIFWVLDFLGSGFWELF